MTSLLLQVISWRALVAAIVVLGFAPGAVLRVIVLAFERSDPRRRELLGELHSVPRWERPLWVGEQLEVALAEGIGSRLARAYRRWAPARRTAEWWRREKDNFLNTRYTVGHGLAAGSYVTIQVYVLVLVPGVGKWIAYITWGLVGWAMAWCHKRNKKRLQPGQPIPATRLDVLIFVLAGPAAYATTIYLFVHDLAMLASGSMSAGYWTGVFLCLLVLLYPWQETLPAVSEGNESQEQVPVTARVGCRGRFASGRDPEHSIWQAARNQTDAPEQPHSEDDLVTYEFDAHPVPDHLAETAVGSL